MQAKLLRVIQERTVDRLGGTKSINLDFRLIVATNKDLMDLVKKKLFRLDLYFRINVFEIQAPSLKHIKDDILLLSQHLISLLRGEMGWGPSKITDASVEILKQYPWPGNVRELRNVLERAMIVAKGNVICQDDLPELIKNYDGYGRRKGSSVYCQGTLSQQLKETEKAAILEALSQTGGNKAKASKILDIHRSSLYEKLKWIAYDTKSGSFSK
jgi:transcriptional regulator with PAS, ATPase and Fis domain